MQSIMDITLDITLEQYIFILSITSCVIVTVKRWTEANLKHNYDSFNFWGGAFFTTVFVTALLQVVIWIFKLLG